MVCSGGFLGQAVFPGWWCVAVFRSRFRRERTMDRIGVGIEVFLPVERTDLVYCGQFAVDHQIRWVARGGHRRLSPWLFSSTLGFFSGSCLKSGVLLKLLDDHLFQFHSGQLQQLDGLLQLRSHDELLGQLLYLANLKSHI